MSDARAGATTADAFLGGAVEAVQPTLGHHRSGLEAVLLAAAVGCGAHKPIWRVRASASSVS